MFHGTMSHMAPEVLMEGKQSKASDVSGMGQVLMVDDGFRGIGAPHGHPHGTRGADGGQAAEQGFRCEWLLHAITLLIS